MSKRGQLIPKGDGKWLLRVYVGRVAKKRKYSSKAFEGTTSQARQALTKMLRESDTKTLVEPSKLTVAEFFEDFYKKKTRIAANTLHDYKKRIDSCVIPKIGHLKLQEVTTLRVQDIYNWMKLEGYAPRTIQYTHSILRQALEWAVELGYIFKNPTRHTERPDAAKARKLPVILIPHQMVLLLAKNQDDSLYALWHTQLNTGMRPGEALALKWSDLQPDTKGSFTISVVRSLKGDGKGNYSVGEIPKTMKSRRTLTLPVSTYEALQKHKQRQAAEILLAGPRYERNDFIFAHKYGGFLQPAGVQKRWKAALKRAKLAHVPWYNTRHSHATALLSNGVNLAWVSERLGHSGSEITLKTYAHVLPEAHREMADTMEGILKKATNQ